MDGYRFVMRNWRVGDKICLFGFSRGAYTARALAGFLYKVSLTVFLFFFGLCGGNELGLMMMIPWVCLGRIIAER